MRIVLKNFRIVDEETDMEGWVIIEDGIITRVFESKTSLPLLLHGAEDEEGAAIIIDGGSLCGTGGLPVLMPAFVDLHAHFRDPGFPGKENLEAASLSAAAGGFGTVVCMANTMPVVDSLEKVLALKKRSGALGLIDLYPAMSLTRGMEGKELSGIKNLPPRTDGAGAPLLLSEDGKDIACDDLFLAVMKEAKRTGIPISCHCDFGGSQAEAEKKAGLKRNVFTRTEENYATGRVIELGKKAGCHIHIAHVSTREAIDMIRRTKAEIAAGITPDGFFLSCEVMPHNLCLTEKDAARLGDETWGRVNPPLRPEEDRRALIRAVLDGTVDAIATDHAPHSSADKENGAPGFSGFETAFAAVYTELVLGGGFGEKPTIGSAADTAGRPSNETIDLKKLSSLMSAAPARFLGFGEGSGGQSRGRILPAYRADLTIIDTEADWLIDPEDFKTKGKNSPFTGRRLRGKILMTFYEGRPVFTAGR